MISFNTDSIKSVYFIAICGTGMAALAGMLKARGYEVRGSDDHVYPPMSTFLDELGIPVHRGFDAQHLEPAPDLIVIGNAMSRGNPEVEAVLDRKLNYISLPFALREFFIRGNYSCVVAGTHGKTSTSSLLAWVLEKSGRDPSFFIGGVPENFSRGYKLGQGEIFVSEGDEYDSAFFDKGSKFLHYLPDLVILNNIEFDHADIFRSIEDIEISFARLINLIPSNGYLVANGDDPVVRKLSQNAFCKIATFGFSEEVEWRAQNIYYDEDETRFDVFYKENKLAHFTAPIFGRHMVANCLSVIAAGNVLGLSIEEIQAGFSTFKNVRRRLQLKGEVDGVKIFDDFAHHPTEVKTTVEALRHRFPESRLWGIFEPRTATSKRRIFEEQFVDALSSADQVIMTPLYRAEKVPENERLSVERVIETLHKRKIPGRILPPDVEMIHFLRQNVKPGDVLLFMSNGDFHQIPQKFLDELNKDRG